MKKFIILMSIILLIGCSNEKTITFGFDSPEAEKIAVSIFKEQHIWFKRKADGRYEFHVSDLRRVKAIYRDSANQIIPMGRSASFDPEMFEIMRKLLDENKISYKIRQYQGNNWIVWEENDSQKIQEIKKKAENELMVMLNENNE